MTPIQRLLAILAVIVVGIPVLPVAVIVIAAWEWRHR